jgi:hypothetical protein
MHDDLLERKLKAALADEARSLPFTITPAELQRRAALRGRGTGNRRLTLLLAAAVAIGALGVGSIVGGAIQRHAPESTAPLTAIGTQSPAPGRSSGPTNPVRLPSLEELLGQGTGTVLVAQSHDLIDGQPELSRQPDGLASLVAFPEMRTAGRYDMTIVCLGDSPMEYAFETVGDGGSKQPIACDGTVNVVGASIGRFPHLVLTYREPTSWRVVVRGDAIALPVPTANPVLDPLEGNVEELARLDDQAMLSTEAWGDTGLDLQELPPLPGRFEYLARLWCPFGESVRLILGDHLGNEPALSPETETVVRCDGLVQSLDLRMVEPHGSRVFLAAAPDARYSVLIASPEPPVALVQKMPGWQLSTGFGPEYAFETHGVSLSNGGVEGGGELLVELECAGPAQQVTVTVDLTEPLGNGNKMFLADCAPDGARTGKSFVTKGNGYAVDFTAPAGTWTALTALIPDPLPNPR